MASTLLKVILFLEFLEVFVSSQCIISVNRDLNEYQPLILKPGTWPTNGNHPYYLPANADGEIMFDSNQEIVLHCPGGPIKAGGEVYDNGIIQITCSFERNFKITTSGRIYPFSSITCGTPAQHSVRRTGQRCTGNNDVLEIGFRLNDGIWLKQITICFDSVCKRTIYTQFDLSSRIDGFQHSVPRPKHFQEGGSFFNLDIDVERCYYIPNQRVNINRQLNLPPNSYMVIDKSTNVFTRGHLTAKSDFVYGSQQGATFYFVNAAPQWMNLNNGNWNELEKSVRNFASYRRRELVIYTGTYEHARLNNVLVFLHRDDVMGHIPVPQYFWKVVYYPEEEAGVVFIGLNNPYEENLRGFCSDVCARLKWSLTWNRNNKNEGFSFCCEINEFRRFVQFPDFPIRRLLTD